MQTLGVFRDVRKSIGSFNLNPYESQARALADPSGCRLGRVARTSFSCIGHCRFVLRGRQSAIFVTALDKLTSWYRAQCNGDWEHSYGITIQTLDNPGWLVTIDLTGTDLEKRSFVPLLRGDHETDHDWIHCKVESGKFTGAGGAGKLAEIIEVFMDWTLA